MNKKECLEIVSTSAEETRQLGQTLSQFLKPGDVVLLIGGLGGGKTTFVQGVAKGLGVQEGALSPTFVLAQTLVGTYPLHHLDFYRLKKKEVWSKGLSDYFGGCGEIPHGIVCVEWADRCQEIWPKDRLEVTVHLLDNPGHRLFCFSPHSHRYLRLLEQFQARYEK